MEMKNFDSKIILPIFLIICCIQTIRTIRLGCLSNQKLRGNICCYTVKCSAGQVFKFCTEDQGHDTCQNCPAGFTHFDALDSKDWGYQLQPCIVKDDCSESDLAVIDGVCSCNRNEGYYGRDRNICAIDDGRCRKAGYQLTIDGDCVMCDEDHFKDEKDKYGLCRPKTRCGNDQEIDDPGSSQKDRTCRTRYTTVKNVPTLPPTNSSLYTTPNHTDKRNNTRNEVHPTITVGETREENKSNHNERIITWVIALCILIIGVIGVVIWFIIKKRKKKKDTDKQSTGTYSFLSCCQKVTNTNIDADVVFCGDNNTTIFKRDDNECERVQFLAQEV